MHSRVESLMCLTLAQRHKLVYFRRRRHRSVHTVKSKMKDSFVTRRQSDEHEMETMQTMRA